MHLFFFQHLPTFYSLTLAALAALAALATLASQSLGKALCRLLAEGLTEGRRTSKGRDVLRTPTDGRRPQIPLRRITLRRGRDGRCDIFPVASTATVEFLTSKEEISSSSEEVDDGDAGAWTTKVLST